MMYKGQVPKDGSTAGTPTANMKMALKRLKMGLVTFGTERSMSSWMAGAQHSDHPDSPGRLAGML